MELFRSFGPALAAAIVLASRVAAQVACDGSAFQYPILFGAEFSNISANSVTNFTLNVTTPEGMLIPSSGLNFCNVTLFYDHPGQNDTTQVQVWLPTPDVWNGRFAAAGGGGFAAGTFNGETLAATVNLGYSSATTDAGHPQIWDRAPWLLNSQGNNNYPLIFNFASVSIHDMTIIGKSITTQYYGQSPKYSYFNGCSTGGRQAMQEAQSYPDDFDGILAGAPAINSPALSLAVYWPQSVMNRLEIFPPQCVMDYIVAAAVKACDAADGVTDGIIADPDLCTFDPLTIVGDTVSDCNGTSVTVTKQAAGIAKSIWQGPTATDGTPLFVGVNRGTPFTGFLALANTVCATGGDSNCTGLPFPMAVDWLKYMVTKDATYDPTTMTLDQLASYWSTSTARLDGIIGGNNPDLSRFKALGRKLISWQGLADECITSRNSRLYYDSVAARDPQAVDTYFRHFEAPGVNHCSGAPGVYYPLHALDALRNWVEGGIAPDVLTGYIIPNGTTQGLGDDAGPTRPLCQYPNVQKYGGGDSTKYSSFSCVPAAQGSPAAAAVTKRSERMEL